jgi:ACR3 family arsenite efflux pump ArsB
MIVDSQTDDPMVIPAIAVVVLSLLTPFVSLCVGLIFLMLSGRRNTTLGWWNVVAGVLGSVLHVVVLAFLLPAVTSGVLTKTLTGLSQQRQQNDVNQSQSILSGQDH